MFGKVYLGDAVYVDFDEGGSAFVLTTSDGIRDTNTVYLEDWVCDAFWQYVKHVSAHYATRHDNEPVKE